MSLAFWLQNDKELREIRGVQPLMIVSLWDMLRVYADSFVECAQTIAYNDGVLGVMEIGAKPRTHHPKPPISKYVLKLRDLCREMGLVETAIRCQDALTLLGRNQIEIAALTSILSKLRFSFQYELKQDVFLQLSRGHGSLYTGKTAFLSTRKLRGIPAVTREAAKARRCFALEEYTAAAFHLIRITEYLLQGFLKKLGLTPDPENETWGRMLKATRDVIQNWDKHHPCRPFRKAYDACWGRLNGVCPSRNDLVHRNQNYSEDDARDLKGAVELCIQAYLVLPVLPRRLLTNPSH